MSDTKQLIRRVVIGAAVVSLAGCVARPHVAAAHVNKGANDTEVVDVVLSAGDAKTIKDREIYFSIVIVDCKNHDTRVPVEPYVAGQLASKFDFPITGESVTFQGTMPAKVFNGFPTPCVALQGGSYLFGKLDSGPVPLVRATGGN